MKGCSLTATVLPLAIACASVGCAKGNTNPLLYVASPALVAGGQRPSAPTGLKAQYDVLLRTIHLTWQASVDPDTGKETPTYRVYLYLVYPPPVFFRPEDRIDETVVREEFFQTDKYTGLLHFVVTGYDGLAESLPSSPLTTSVP